MKKTATILLIISLLIISATLGFHYFAKAPKVDASVALEPSEPKKTITTEQFAWGVFTNPYAFNTRDEGFIKANIDKQIQYLVDIGVNTVRFNYEFDPKHPEIIRPENDYLVDKLIENNITPYMVIENEYSGEDFFTKSSQEGAYKWGTFIAGHFKGRVKYYQILNEVSGTAMKKDYPGFRPSDYEEYKYQSVKNFLLGLTKAIRDIDPTAQRIVNCHWVATAMIDRLIEDKVDFEIIGWNWFSDMGDNITSVKADDNTTINIPKHFAPTGKKIWITELNRQEGSFGNKDNDQAKFIKRFVTNARKEPNVRGIFVFKMFDTVSIDGKETKDTNWGLVGNSKQNGSWGPGEKKQAYYEFKDLIARSLAGM